MMNRRDMLKQSSVLAMGLGLNFFSPALFKRKLIAGPMTSPRKMIFIFQRGGNDAVNTIIPRGDSQYSTGNRPSLFIPQGNAIDLGNGFAQAHPALAPLMEIYNSTALNGVAGPGNLAVLHRIGYAGQSQSHFSSQQYWENGVPGDEDLDEGMIYRQIAATMDPGNSPFVAAAISSSQMVALKGPITLPAFNNPNEFLFNGNTAQVQKFLGQLPSSPVGGDGKGMLGLYGGPRDSIGKPYRDLVYGTGLTLVESINIVQTALQQGPYTPENGATYPNGGLGDRLRQVSMLLKRTPVRVLGVNVGGWDTHSDQGGANGQHANLLGELAQGIQALSRDLQSQWDDVIIVTMSEFGRTSIENGSQGTDHAHAGVMLVAGGRVNGGVYNCDSSTWANGDLLSVDNRYIRRRTDYRAVFGEIFMRHFGDDLPLVNQVIPGYSAAASANPSDFNFLNFVQP